MTATKSVLARPVALVAAVVLGLLGGSGVAYALKVGGDNRDAEVATAAITASQEKVTDVMGGLEDADLVADLARAGEDADRAATELRSSLDATDEIADEARRDATRRALRPSLALLEAAGRLTALTPASLKDWSTVKVDLEDANRALEAAQPGLAALGGAQAPELAFAAVDDGIEGADGLVVSAQAKLARWRREVRKSKRERGGALESAVAYRRTVQGLLSTYADTRHDLQLWIDQVEVYNATFDEAYTELSAQKDARERVRTGIASAGAPSGVAPVHTRVLSVIDSAIDAMDSAIDGAQQREQSADDYYGDYGSYDETPAWADFVSASQRIGQEFPAASKAWQSEIDKYISDLKRNGGGLEKPQV